MGYPTTLTKFNSVFFLAVVSVFALAANHASAADELVYFATLNRGPGNGVSLAHFDPDTGVLSPAKLAVQTDSPSWVAFSADGQRLYATNHTPGSVSAYTADSKAGTLAALNTVPAGAGASHVSLDHTGHYLLEANGNGGSVDIFALKPDGSLGDHTGHDQHDGHGPNPARQATPYAHCIIADPTNHFLLCTDLGNDHVYVYKFDAATGKIAPNDPPFVTVAPGLGPRHLAFHPNGKIVYLLNEMGSAIVVFQWDADKGVLTALQTISTLPADFKGENNAAEILVRADGKFVYASNRGSDSIAVFAVDPATFKLTHLQDTPTQGKTPRALAFDPTGKWIIAGNQDSNTALVLRVDGQTGQLSPVGQPVAVPAPSGAAFRPELSAK